MAGSSVEPLGRTGEHHRLRWPRRDGAALEPSHPRVRCMAVVPLTPGAGATLAALVSAFPQLIWLSLHRGWVSELPVDCSLLPLRARKVPCRRAPGGPLRAPAVGHLGALRSGRGKSCPWGNPRLCPRVQSAVMELSRACRANFTGSAASQSPIPWCRPTLKSREFGSFSRL
jgi:hypothetical protein